MTDWLWLAYILWHFNTSKKGSVANDVIAFVENFLWGIGYDENQHKRWICHLHSLGSSFLNIASSILKREKGTRLLSWCFHSESRKILQYFCNVLQAFVATNEISESSNLPANNTVAVRFELGFADTAPPLTASRWLFTTIVKLPVPFPWMFFVFPELPSIIFMLELLLFGNPI